MTARRSLSYPRFLTLPLASGLVLYAFLCLPPVARWMEGSLVGHMLVQIPFLALAGGLLARGAKILWPEWLERTNEGGVPGTILAVLVLLFWMLPRSLDAALVDPRMEVAKFLMVPFLIGAPLAPSWPALGFVGKGFVLVNGISMLAVAGWLYLAAPVRLCNAYLVDQQTVGGYALLSAAAALAVAVLAYGLLGPPRRASGA